MRRFALITALTMAATNAAMAEDSRIEKLCGVDHRNELVSPQDATANPAGYYIASLQVQLPLGDPRIIATNENTFHLCTRSPAVPDMDPNKAMLLMKERTVKFLFVPMKPPAGHDVNLSG
jgi:hypothetical protein